MTDASLRKPSVSTGSSHRCSSECRAAESESMKGKRSWSREFDLFGGKESESGVKFLVRLKEHSSNGKRGGGGW